MSDKVYIESRHTILQQYELQTVSGWTTAEVLSRLHNDQAYIDNQDMDPQHLRLRGSELTIAYVYRQPDSPAGPKKWRRVP